MTRLRVAIRVPVGLPLPEIATFAARCEDAGSMALASTTIPPVGAMALSR
jgi:hypothetical protein